MWVRNNQQIYWDKRTKRWVLLIRNLSNPILGRYVDLNTQNIMRAKEMAGGGEWEWITSDK